MAIVVIRNVVNIRTIPNGPLFPVVLSVTPNVGSTLGGTTIDLHGSGFTGVTAVILGGSNCQVVGVLDSDITCITGPHAAGTADVTVGTGTFTGLFTFSPPPTLTATPQSGPWRGVSKTFAGTNLSGATSLTINGAAATVTGSTSTSVTVTTPAFTLNGGPYDVVVTTPLGNSGTTGAAIYWVVADLNDFSGLIADWAGDIGVTSSGGLVSNVADQSGAGNDVSATGTARPTLTATAAPLATGKTYFSLDGVANTLTRTSMTLSTGELSFFSIARNNATGAHTPNVGLFMYNGWSTAGNAGVCSSAAGTNQIAVLVRSFNFTATGASIAGPAWHAVSAVWRNAAANETAWIDGAATTDTVGGALAASGKIEIGSLLSAWYLQCDFAEMALYNVNQEARRFEIEQWLKQKWFGGGAGPGYLQSSALSTTAPVSLTPSTIVSPQGDLDVEFDLNFGFNAGAGAVVPDTYLFSAASPDGVISLRYSQSAPGWSFGGLTFTVRGVDVMTLIQAGFASGDSGKCRIWYRITTNESGIRFTVNGSVIEIIGTTTGTVLSAATSAWLGRDAANAHPFQAATWTGFRSYNISATPISLNPEIVITGDSIGTAYPYDDSIAGFLYSSALRTTRPGIINQCKFASDLPQQQTFFDVSMYKGRGSVKCVILQGGINDIHADNQTTAAVVARYQAFVNDIRAAHPTAKIYGCQLSPCRSVITVPHYAVWQAMNIAIAGGGATPVTGLDRVISSHVAALNDGSDNLAVAYSYDGLHMNQAGKQVLGLAIRAGLLADGLVT